MSGTFTSSGFRHLAFASRLQRDPNGCEWTRNEPKRLENAGLDVLLLARLQSTGQAPVGLLATALW